MNSIKREENTSFSAAEGEQNTRPDVSEVCLLFYNSLLERRSNGVPPWHPGRGQFLENGSYNLFLSVVKHIFGAIMHIGAGVK